MRQEEGEGGDKERIQKLLRMKRPQKTCFFRELNRTLDPCLPKNSGKLTKTNRWTLDSCMSKHRLESLKIKDIHSDACVFPVLHNNESKR